MMTKYDGTMTDIELNLTLKYQNSERIRRQLKQKKSLYNVEQDPKKRQQKR